MTKLCDFSKLTKPLHHYRFAIDCVTDDGLMAVTLRRTAVIENEPIVFTSTNKFDVRLAIREANEILSAIHRLKGDTNAQ